MTIEAIYDGETFKPKLPVDLPPNAKVKLTVELLSDDPDEQKKQEERRKAFLEAARKAQGIRANHPDIDEAYQQLGRSVAKMERGTEVLVNTTILMLLPFLNILPTDETIARKAASLNAIGLSKTKTSAFVMSSSPRRRCAPAPTANFECQTF